MESTSSKKVVFLEFNELCPRLMDQWMESGDLPNFKRLHDESEVFVTESDEVDPKNMEPWIQWYSLHTGLPFSEHRVFHLTDGPKGGHPDIWNMLREHGKRVMNFSSMNARGMSGKETVFLPDPWCTSETAYPDDLKTFHHFLANQIQEYSNPNQQNRLATLIKTITFLFTHGVGLRTIGSICRQLASEVLQKKTVSWKRVFLMDRLLLDVFKHYWTQEQPNFATFFSNSTAHLQHSYWRHMEPEAFSVKPSQNEMDVYGQAIQAGYKNMDRMVGELMKMANHHGATLMFATALSQQPFLKYEATGGQHFYRPHNVEALLSELGIRYLEIYPVMTHQYQLIFASSEDRLASEQTLGSIQLDGKNVFGLKSSDPLQLYFGCQLNQQVAKGSALGNASKPGWKLDFFENFYKIDALKSGRHHPDGCFWIQSAKHARAPQKVSILDVLPTVLDSFGIQQPALPGKSVLRTL